MMNGLRLAFIGMGLLWGLSGCTPAEHFPSTEEGQLSNRKIKSVSYPLVQKNVLEKHCLKCHSGKESPNLTTYENVKNNLAAIKFTTLKTKNRKKIMPPKTRLSEYEKQLLSVWIEMGSPQQKTLVDAAPDSQFPPLTELNINFSQVTKFVLEPACNRCHSKDNANGISDYTDIEEVRGAFTAIQKLSMDPSFDLMPPRVDPPDDFDEDWIEEEYDRETEQTTANPNRLSSEQKDLLYRWYLNGLAED